jgi:hypothetical protein
MASLKAETMNFMQDLERERGFARAVAALQLSCGADLAAALKQPASGRARLLARVAHALNRERQKGLRRHWSYDLNRHIALKQAFDLIRAA